MQVNYSDVMGLARGLCKEKSSQMRAWGVEVDADKAHLTIYVCQPSRRVTMTAIASTSLCFESDFSSIASSLNAQMGVDAAVVSLLRNTAKSASSAIAAKATIAREAIH